jgi:hypothetical protein
MRKFVLSFALTATATMLLTVPTHAQARVFVGAQGSDSNPCTFALPCRTFQHAHDVVLAGGEIDVLDPAGYGKLTITKSISIQGHDFSGISSLGDVDAAITITAGLSDIVNLRGLIIEGAGFGGNGIVFNSAAAVHVQDSVVRTFTGDGIVMVGNLASGMITFRLTNVIVADNGGNGIYVQPTGNGFMNVMLNRVEIYNNRAHGFALSGINQGPSCGGQCAQAVATDSVAAHNGLAGFAVTDGALLALKRVVSSYNNLVGILVNNNSFLDLSDTTSWINWGQNSGINCTGDGVIRTFGDNTIEDIGILPGSCFKVSFGKF